MEHGIGGGLRRAHGWHDAWAIPLAGLSVGFSRRCPQPRGTWNLAVSRLSSDLSHRERKQERYRVGSGSDGFLVLYSAMTPKNLRPKIR